MSRHRAPSPSRLSITGVLAGTTLGASVLLPGTALGQPAASAASGPAGSADGPTSGTSRHDPRDADDDGSGRHRSTEQRDARQHARHRGHPRHHATHPRPLTSGERQYRNGCRQGYILDGCAQFDVPHLLRRGINPFG